MSWLSDVEYEKQRAIEGAPVEIAETLSELMGEIRHIRNILERLLPKEIPISGVITSSEGKSDQLELW